MPRAQRICYPGAVYHVYQRGNNKQDIFVDDMDKWHILKLFLEAKKQFGFFLHCYALMRNHFHVTIETPDATPISEIMQSIQGSYAIYFNSKYGRKGHLFQGRFKNIIVEKDSYLLELSRYIHLNPVKAGYALSPADYQWSSYRIYAGIRRDLLINTDTLLSYFDANNRQRAQEEYKSFVESAIPLICEKEDWLKKNIIRQRFLGSSDFIKNLQKRCQASTQKAPDLPPKSA